MRPLLAATLACACFSLFSPPLVRADAEPGNPTAYDLRIGLFPVAFQAGISQGSFGSAITAGYALHRSIDIDLTARIPWWIATGERSRRGYFFDGTILFHVSDALEEESLGGTVYPEDTPAISGAGTRGADRDLDIPVSQRLGGPRMVIDRDHRLVAVMRNLHSLRIGFAYARAVERARPRLPDDSSLGVDNTVPMLHVGYGWGTHWNLRSEVTGSREIGYRRFYVELLATVAGVIKSDPLFDTMGDQPDFFPLGARLGMQGSMGALLATTPSVGFAYNLELGALPGHSGFEGYLFIGLGLALDAATR